MANKVIVTKSKLTNLANTIRSKTGSTDTMTVDEMNELVQSFADIGPLIDGTVTSVVIPEGTNKIKFYTFAESNLAQVEIPSSVKSIENNAFLDCTNLTSVTIKDGVTQIGEAAFGNCSSLTSLVLPDSVTSLSKHSFYRMLKLTDIVLSQNVVSIPSYCFEMCQALQEITIPNSVTSIEQNAFLNCSQLKKVYVPTTISTIDDSAFTGTHNSFYIIPYDTLYEYGNAAGILLEANGIPISKYKGSENTVTIPSTVSYLGTVYNIEVIDVHAFEGNESITKVIIPNTVSGLLQHAFSSCTNLNEITFSSTLITIQAYAFSYCSNLTNVTLPDRLVYIMDGAFVASGLVNITIPDSVTTIGTNAFIECRNLENITIGSGVTSIGDNILAYNNNLLTIQVSSNNTTYDSRNNCNALIETSTNTLLAGSYNTVIPNDIISIGTGAFIELPITTISIPASVTSIGSSAFHSCTKLQLIDFSNHMSIPTVGFWVFYNVASGCRVVLPDALYDEWIAADGWKDFTELTYVKASEVTE